jgi:hypothetical protein
MILDDGGDATMLMLRWRTKAEKNLKVVPPEDEDHTAEDRGLPVQSPCKAKPEGRPASWYSRTA